MNFFGGISDNPLTEVYQSMELSINGGSSVILMINETIFGNCFVYFSF